MEIVKNILETIGDTPIIQLERTDETSADVYVKLESFNPAGSVKDRIALSMIEAAEKSGELKKGMSIVEPTSGNTGVGLAFVAASKGYDITLVMPETFSVERRMLMQAYGANLVLTPGSEGMKGAIAKAQELAETKGYFMPLQFENKANPAIHEMRTGEEIVAAFDGEQVDAFVAGVGTGGTITGAGTVLKQAFPSIQITAVESAESPVLSGGNPSPHKIQGISAGFIPKVLNTEIYDSIEQVTSEEAMEEARNLAKKGIMVGISSGAAVVAAKRIAKQLGAGKKVVTIAADSGERYLSTALYNFE